MDTARAPADMACRARSTTSRVRMVPTWEITGTRPSAALSTCSSTCLRSSRVSSSPSPEDPQQ